MAKFGNVKLVKKGGSTQEVEPKTSAKLIRPKGPIRGTLETSGGGPSQGELFTKAAISGLLGPVASEILDLRGGSSVARNPLEAFRRGISQGQSVGFSDELAGGVDFASKALTGQTDPLSPLDELASAIEGRRQAFDQTSADFPVASTAGEIGGAVSIPIGGPAKALGFGAKIGRGAKIGGTLGALFGAGKSRGSLLEGDIGEVAADTAIGGALGGTLGAAAPTILGGLARGGRKLITPSRTLHELATGGKGTAPSKLFEKATGAKQSQFVDAIDTASKHKILKLEQFGFRSPSVEKGKGAITKQVDKFKDFFLSGPRPEFDAMRADTHGTISKLSNNIDDIVLRASKSKGTIYKLDDVFGKDAPKQIERAISNAKLNPATSKVAQELDSFIDTEAYGKLLKGNASAHDVLQVKRMLSRVIGNFDDATPGSMKDKLQSIFFRSRDIVNKEVSFGLPKEFDKFQTLNKDTSNLLTLQKVLRSGQAKAGSIEAGGELFRGDVVGSAAEVVPGLVGLGTRSGAGKLIGRALSIPIRGTALAADKTIGDPKFLGWVSGVLPSYNSETNTVTKTSDKEMYSHFIDGKEGITLKKKAKLKTQLHTSGKIDPDIIPKDVRAKALEKLTKEGL